MRHAMARQRRGENFRVPADQKRLGDTREKRRQLLDPARLADAAGDPDEAVIAAHGARRGIGIGRLAVIDEAHVLHHRHFLLAVRQARIGPDPFRNRRLGNAERPGHRGGGGGVLRVMGAGQRLGRPRP